MTSLLKAHSTLLTSDQGTTVAGYPRTRWLQVMPHLGADRGGISAVVPQLGLQLATSQRFSVSIAAFCGAEERDSSEGLQELHITRWPASRSAWMASTSTRRGFRKLLETVDGVHIHGLWEASSAVAARMARAARRPYVISAHGMLEPWALANKGAKKKLYAALVERANLEGAACLHALTRAEADDYRRFGSTRPIAVIPNGVEVPESATATLLLDRFPQLRGKPIVLFLGRIHFKKGLDLLVKAWTMLADEHPEAVLVIAGPDSENTQAAVQAAVGANGLTESVVFTGMLHGAFKWSALAAATAFVLPSYSEGFSVAVLEAMGMGLPVIVTTRCHLPEVHDHGAGWQIRPEVLELFAALQDVLSNSPAANAEIGRRGQRLVQERFSWNAVSAQMAELYRWTAGGPRPTSFELQETYR